MAGIDSYTKLMLHMNGADGSTEFTDSSLSPKTVTPQGNAQITTALGKFGGTPPPSGLFDGSGDFVYTGDSDDFNFAAGDFTIDFWFALAANLGSWRPAYEQYADANNKIIINIRGNPGSLNVTVVSGGAAFFDWFFSPGNLSADTFYHFAFVRTGDSWMCFLNGSQVGTTQTLSGSMPDVAGNVNIGKDSQWGSWYHRCLDEFRVSKGIARWTANFTPPTEEYTFPGYTLSADAGSYTKTGQTSGLRAARKIPASPDSYPLTGQSVTLKAMRKVAAGSDSYLLSGQLAILIKRTSLAAGPESYALTGQSANLKSARLIAAGAGSYILTGPNIRFMLTKNVTIVGIDAISGRLVYITGKLNQT